MASCDELEMNSGLPPHHNHVRSSSFHVSLKFKLLLFSSTHHLPWKHPSDGTNGLLPNWTRESQVFLDQTLQPPAMKKSPQLHGLPPTNDPTYSPRHTIGLDEHILQPRINAERRIPTRPFAYPHSRPGFCSSGRTCYAHSPTQLILTSNNISIYSNGHPKGSHMWMLKDLCYQAN